MKRIIIFVVVIASMFMLVSCGSGPGSNAISYNFKQGSAGLEVKFLPKAPPPKIYPTSDFKMIVDMKNLQAYDVTQAKMKLVGIEGKYFDVNPLEQNLDVLVGRSLEYPSGDQVFVEFSVHAGELFQNAEQYRNPFFLKVHYFSSMEFTDTICVNPSFYKVYDGGCQQRERKSYSGQGAAIAVRSVEQIVFPSGTGTNLEYRFTLGNAGRGKVGFVNLGKVRLGGKDLSCEFTGKGIIDKRRVELKDIGQKTTLICKTFLKDQRSYETTLTADFTYDYEISQQHSLNLVK